MDTLFNELLRITDLSPFRLILSNPVHKNTLYKKIVLIRKETYYQAEKYTHQQVFHENLTDKTLSDFCMQYLGNEYLQLNAWTDEWVYEIKVTKKGKILTGRSKNTSSPVKMTAHNRIKQYILKEGIIIPPLIDMGIFSPSGHVISSMYDKFRQINRFVEIIDDSLKNRTEKELTVIDFGCGKSYLTFVLYYYFTEIKKIKVRMIGLDLKADVIKKCNNAAQKYGYDGLRFELGNINGYHCEFPVDMVITLHACDTATDYALFNAVNWNAKMIFSVPCCQHELNRQIQSDNLSLLTRYGIVKERTAALFTDAVRANLLECCGYKTQILEFIDFAHTPKNLLIRAQKTGIPSAERKKALQEVTALTKEFHLSPTLLNLLSDSGYLKL